MVGDFLDERVRHVGDRNAACRGGGDIDGVDPHGAERDDLAALEAVDDALGDEAPFGVQRIGVAGGIYELVICPGRDLDDLRRDRGQAFHFQLVAYAWHGETGPYGCDDRELCHTAPPWVGNNAT
jgi:hypothetical protein